MRQVFRVGETFTVPDGTGVAPLFNPLDSLSGLSGIAFQGFSLAVGVIKRGQRSKIHLLPHVSQLTVVMEGNVTLRMKGPADPRPFALRLRQHQAGFTAAGTLLQLINDGPRACRLLYIVSPSYVFEYRDGKVVYDDALTLEQSWAQLARSGWRHDARPPSRRARAAAAARIAQKPIPKRTP